MPFTRVKITNLYSFDETELSLTYARKPVNSPLDFEYLEQRDNFYFKKICIISGANASGKTSFGRALLGIQNFIDNNQLVQFYLDKFTNPEKPASFDVDYVDIHSTKHNRLHVLIEKDASGTLAVVSIKFASIFINKNDSCTITTRKLNEIFKTGKVFKSDKSEYIDSSVQGIIGALEAFKLTKPGYGWHFVLSENTETNSKFKDIDNKVLSAVLRTFDNTIQKVDALIVKDKSKKENSIEGYSIVFSNNDKVMIDLSGDITNTNRLSKGTYEAIRIAQLLSRLVREYNAEIKENTRGSSIYYLDEKMAYTHTELEKLILTLIINKIGCYNQFFYTTHNYDVLNLDLPIHSFVFTKKENGITRFVEASSVCKKNDRKLLNYVKNDAFETLPDLSLLEELLLED